MGGAGAHEYMAPCAAGEDDIVLGEGYAANVEVAVTTPSPAILPDPVGAPELVSTPGAKTIKKVAEQLGVDASATLKALVVIGPEQQLDPGARPRRRHGAGHQARPRCSAARTAQRRLRRSQPRSARSGTWGQSAWSTRRRGSSSTRRSATSSTSSAPIRSTLTCAACSRDAISRPSAPTCARPRPATPSTASPWRSCPRSRSATSSSSAPSTPRRSALRSSTRTARASRSSWAVTASARRASSRRPPSSSVTSAASRGRRRSRRGRSTSRGSASPALRRQRPPRSSPSSCRRLGFEVLLDDRPGGAGEKLTDAELLGCPLRLVVGRRTLERGEAEAQLRRGSVELPGAIACRSGARRSRASRRGAMTDGPQERGGRGLRRLFGIDRSGPPPPSTLPGSPLNRTPRRRP